MPHLNVNKEVIERELMNLVDQHNVKVQQISCAVGIINTLHLFYQRSDHSPVQDYQKMTQIVTQLLSFQRFLIEHFREQFDMIFEEVLAFLPPPFSTYAV